MAIATDRKLEELSINSIRMLSIDGVQAANSGHPGLPMGAAAMAYVLWTEYLKHNPSNPHWFDRDRFVLSAGHGSMLLYSLLHLTGYDLPLEELKRFRQLDSKTPGHPEGDHTPGVEVTTGPLGAGFSNGVGMAIAEAYLAAHFNRPGHDLINHHTYAIVSDGDIMEGVAMEAASLAGHLGLGKLIYLYDQNHITLAGSANVSFSENVAARFEALGWHTVSIDGLNTDAVRRGINEAITTTDKPSLIICRTVHRVRLSKQGQHLRRPRLAARTRRSHRHQGSLRLANRTRLLPPRCRPRTFPRSGPRGREQEAEWDRAFEAYAAEYPDMAAELGDAIAGRLPAGWDADLPTWEPGSKVATRKAGEAVIPSFFPRIPTFIGGSADLNPSTNTGMKGAGDFANPNLHLTSKVQGALGGDWGYAGRNIHFGIREHAMGGAVNGMAAHGGVIPFSATFLVFSDYMRPTVRLAALSGYKSIFVFTHDSVAVGEDGPTHEPVEQIMSMRLIPDLTVIRPADGNETAAAWRHALESSGPSVIVLSRQDLPTLDLTKPPPGPTTVRTSSAGPMRPTSSCLPPVLKCSSPSVRRCTCQRRYQCSCSQLSILGNLRSPVRRI